MEEETPKRSGWRIWLYMTPVYILVAIPLVKWTMRVNSGDVALNQEGYSAFNAQEGEIKKTSHANYDPGLNDLGYSVRYRSGNEPAAGLADDRPAGKAPEARPVKADPETRTQPQQAQYRQQTANQVALEANATKQKSYMSFGYTKNYLTEAVGKAMNNPKAVSALMNNEWVVKGFMGRDTTRAATGSAQGAKNYLSNPQNVSNFLGNPVVKAAMNNPAVVNAFASSAMASAMLSSPGVQAMLKDPQAIQQMVMTNPQLMQILSNQNVMGALANNPQTAGLVGSLGGGMPQLKR